MSTDTIAPTLQALDNLQRTLEALKPIRLRLLTSIENDASISEFLDGVQTTLNLEDLALYFVNPEKQKLGTGSRSGKAARSVRKDRRANRSAAAR